MKTMQQLNSLALETRRKWNEDSYSPIDIFAIVNGLKDLKLTLVNYSFSNNISGMSVKVDDDYIIYINSNMSYGRQRFTLAHEMYHVLYEDFKGSVICDMSLNEHKSDSEKEADIFASYLLMPFDSLYQYSQRINNNWDLEHVIEAEQFYRISHAAMMARLIKEDLINSAVSDCYSKVVISKEARKLGFDSSLYLASPNDRKYFTMGEYIRKAELLLNKELITNGYWEELLLDSFRSDIVFNLDLEDLGYEE